jgi:hypothetical protein
MNLRDEGNISIFNLNPSMSDIFIRYLRHLTGTYLAIGIQINSPMLG